jgi:tetratricopeptide (TPR) repeat protein
MSTAPTSIAEGTLAETPFAHVLLSIERRALGGTLAVWPEDGSRGQDRVLFEAGKVVAARVLEPAAALVPGLLPLFGRTRAPYAFYAEDLVGDGEGVLRGAIPTEALLATGLRVHPREDIAARVLAGHAERPLRLPSGGELAGLGLLPNERAIVELLLAGPASVERLVARSGDPATARRVLYLLTITKKLAPHDAAAPRDELAAAAPRESTPSGRFTAVPEPPPERASAAPPRPLTPSAPEAPPSPPAGLAPELRARWAEIADLAEAMDDYNHFQLLGVTEAASVDEVHAAYAERVKRLHPDRLPRELAPLAPTCQRVFHQLTEAKKALADAEARMAHVKAIRSGGGTPAHDRKLAAIVGAAMEFQKVEVLVRQRRYEDALALLDRVLSVAPEEPDYLARKAWVLFLLHPEKRGPFAQQILALTDRALAKNERHEQAHFTKASMLKRQGHPEAALEHFRLAEKANPKNIDAAREVRLAEMRSREGGAARSRGATTSNEAARSRGAAPEKSQDAGLLQKLFGKKS